METGAISHAEIEIEVTDANGSVLPGSTGILSGTLIGDREEVANSEGRMVFAEVPPGAYTVRVSLEGFTDVVRELTIHDMDEHDRIVVQLDLAAP